MLFLTPEFYLLLILFHWWNGKEKKKSFNFLFSFSSLNVLLSVPTQVSVLLCPQVCFWKSSILVVTPFDAVCLLCFKVLLGPSDNHDSFLVVSLLGRLLPICIAYHLVGNNMRVLHLSKIKFSLLFRKLFTELLQFIYCRYISHVHVYIALQCTSQTLSH